MSNQIVANPLAKQQITAFTFAAKFKSKKEVFLLLTIDVRAYLPPHTTVTSKSSPNRLIPF